MSLQQRVDPHLLKGALAVVKTLHNQGHEAYFAGGAVRDLILEKNISEIDLATSASPQEIEQLFPKTIPVGKQFGVMIVVQGTNNYEVTTFRKESDYVDGRHPTQVSFTNARNDVERRDFTVGRRALPRAELRAARSGRPMGGALPQRA